MRLLGVSSLAELEPKHVTQLARLVPVGPAARAAAAHAARGPEATSAKALGTEGSSSARRGVWG